MTVKKLEIRVSELNNTTESNAKYLLRQLFYFRGPLGTKVEEQIAEQDNNLWREIYKELENPYSKMGGF